MSLRNIYIYVRITIIIVFISSNTLYTQNTEIVNYKINAKLNVREKSIPGYEILTWYNDSSEEVKDLQFHLYLNGFKNNKSTYFKEIGFASLKEDEWGWIDILSFKIFNGDDLTRRIEYIQPDDENREDQTVMRVILPESIKPHQKITIEIEFYSKLPKAIRRVGYSNNFFFVCQWYPKIGVYEEKGKRGAKRSGWNCHQFHASSEFYSDFGTFEVTLTVPSNFIVGATGIKLSEKDNLNGTKTLSFYGEKIHDFAWTADPDFIVFKDKFHYYGLKDVDIIYLCQPGHEFTVSSYIQRAKDVLKYYGLWFGPYPYKKLTIVDPAKGANSGGMEYPNLITAGTSYLLKFWPLNRIPFIDEVVVHEVGHQWWYGMVGNNEFENAWLDEGLNTYSADINVAGVIYPKKIQSIFFNELSISMIDLQKAMYIVDPESDPIQKFCWEFYNGGGRFYYTKAALMLKTIEMHIGQKQMNKVLKAFFEKWRYKHPGPEDFINNLEEITGKNFRWFFNQVLYGTNELDYSISKIICKRIKPARGVFDRGNRNITIYQKDIDSLAKIKMQNKMLFKNTVYVRRLGEVIFPVEIEVKFENGEIIKENWNGKKRWKKFEYIKPYKVEYAIVDPDNKIPLDINITNNSKMLKPVLRGTLKWFFKWMFWIQNILELCHFFS
ncbi:hypothetical protein DRQ09_10775 [candidate division KSB1 bacterium]|nr:MAG: hypothetical protein DRQ09_10775 [candidate division KSB1 bacterium]